MCVKDGFLERNNYCAKPNTNTDVHSGYRAHNRLGAQAQQSSLEYDLVTKITIRLLNQPVMCKTGSSIFAATVRIKVVITTSDSFPIIPSTDMTNRK